MVRSHPGRVISVGGGKGGVGKSVIAANLAVAMAQAGARVVLLDADFGAANQHTLFGISRPGPGVEAFLGGEVDQLASVAVETGVPRLTLVPGSGGVVGSANLPSARKQKLIRHLRALDADVVLVDVGAGVSFNALDLFDAAHLRLVVMTSQLTSAQNAYAFLKGAVFRELRRIAAATGQQARIDEAEEGASPTAGTPQLLARLAGDDPALARSLQAGLAAFGARLLGNQIFKPADVNVVYALSRMARDFLGLDVPVMGALRASRRVHDSVNGCRPHLLQPGGEGDEFTVTLRGLARTLLAAPLTGGGLDDSPASTGPRPALEAASLPAAMSAYERASARHPVDLGATLIYPGGLASVRVKDVSETGALLELERPPLVGARVTLVLSQLSEQPSMACVVRHASPETRRAGVEFIAPPDAARSLAERIRGAGAPRG
jgi:flagellar biosynthesis protein FlhG